MRFLISVCVVLCCFSCGIPTVKGLHDYPSDQLEFINPYFSNADTDYIYKTKIKAFGNVFGGILIIKKLDTEHHRVVFTTSFGNKLFDFELLKNETKIHFIMEELNRKLIINTLKRDFRTLTQIHHHINKAFKKDSKTIVFQCKAEKRFNHFFVASKTQELQHIIHTSKTKEKIKISFSGIQNTIAKTINIQHNNAPIRIDLTYVNNL